MLDFVACRYLPRLMMSVRKAIQLLFTIGLLLSSVTVVESIKIPAAWTKYLENLVNSQASAR